MYLASNLVQKTKNRLVELFKGTKSLQNHAIYKMGILVQNIHQFSATEANLEFTQSGKVDGPTGCSSVIERKNTGPGNNFLTTLILVTLSILETNHPTAILKLQVALIFFLKDYECYIVH